MSRVTLPKLRRALLALALVVAIVWVALPHAARTMIVAHPLGTTAAPYAYLEVVPDTPGPWPLVLMLHGRGEVGDGTDPMSIAERLPPIADTARARLTGTSSPIIAEGAIVVAPQSQTDWSVAALNAFLDHLFAVHPIDPNRVYVTGISMGGAGTAAYAAVHPARLAAAMPICGAWFADPRATERLDALPVRAFHGYEDAIVTPRATSEWVGSIALHRGASEPIDPLDTYPQRDATAVFDGHAFVWRDGTSAAPDETLTLTEIAHAGHVVWPQVYGDEATWRWLFAQRRAQ